MKILKSKQFSNFMVHRLSLKRGKPHCELSRYTFKCKYMPFRSSASSKNEIWCYICDFYYICDHMLLHFVTKCCYTCDFYYICDQMLLRLWLLLHLWPNVITSMTFITFVTSYYICAFNSTLRWDANSK